MKKSLHCLWQNIPSYIQIQCLTLNKGRFRQSTLVICLGYYFQIISKILKAFLRSNSFPSEIKERRKGREEEKKGGKKWKKSPRCKLKQDAEKETSQHHRLCLNTLSGCEINFPCTRVSHFRWSDELCQIWKATTNGKPNGNCISYSPVTKTKLSEPGSYTSIFHRVPKGTFMFTQVREFQRSNVHLLYIKCGQCKFTFRRHLPLPPNQPRMAKPPQLLVTQ